MNQWINQTVPPKAQAFDPTSYWLMNSGDSYLYSSAFLATTGSTTSTASITQETPPQQTPNLKWLDQRIEEMRVKL